MSKAVGQFPAKVWDTTTPGKGIVGQERQLDTEDWNQVILELTAMQKEILPGAWAAISLTAGWTAKASHIPKYKVDGSKRVKLAGAFVPGTKTDNTLIGTLPVGARPTTARTFPVVAYAGDTNDAGASVLIGTDGTIKCFGFSTATSCCVDGIEFDTDY